MAGGADNSLYEFGDFRLDLRRRRLTRTDGAVIALTGKPYDALVYLVEHPGEPASRAALTEALWPTNVVEDNNLNQTISALRRALGDDASSPHRYVATIARRGYQFVAPVRQVVDGAPKAEPISQTALRTAKSSRGRMALLIGAAVIAGVLLAGPLLFDPVVPASDDFAVLPRSIAVLPFRNLSPNAADAYFAEGIHEEILNQVARIPGLDNVIARTSVLQYANSTIPITEIARELRVAFVVEGSVRYASDRVRVSVRLVDGSTSAEIWSEPYETDLQDIIAVQANIASRIAAALESEIPPADVAGIAERPTTSVAAYARYLKAISLYRTSGGTGVSTPRAVRDEMLAHLEKAIELDPGFAVAHAWRAYVNVDSLTLDSFPEHDWPKRSAELIRLIEADAGRALDLSPANGTAHAALARLNTYRWRRAEALATLERARRLNPNDAAVWTYAAIVSLMLDDDATAVEQARRAVELDPKNAAAYSPLGSALIALGDVDAAAAAFGDMVDLAPTAAIGYVSLARAELMRGNDAGALEALRFAEQFFAPDTRNFRLDAALSYAALGRQAEAQRLVGEFRGITAQQHVDAGIEAMALLARGEHEKAYEHVLAANGNRDAGLDPFPLLLIRRNAWRDPVLEGPEWIALRAALRYRE